MTDTYNRYTGDGTTTSFAVTFPQYSWTSVLVYVDNVRVTTGYTYNSATQAIVFTTAPALGLSVTLQRQTDVDLLYKFGQGAAFTGSNVDSNFLQYQTAVEEVQNAADRVYLDNALEDERNARVAADASLQSQITGATPIMAAQVPAVMWHERALTNSVVVPAGMNAFSIGPQFVINPGQDITLGAGSTYTVIGNAFERSELYDVTADNLTTSDSASTVSVTALAALPERMSAEEAKVQPVALGGTGNSTGLAASATKLATARSVQVSLASTTGAAFDGTTDITPGVTGVLDVTNGGTGNSTGQAASAVRLSTSRTLTTVLSSGSGASFDGTANASIGVSGVLPVASGGTGASTVTAARNALGAAASAGVTDGSNAVAGIVGEFVELTGSSVTLNAGVDTNGLSMTLQAGDWDVSASGAFIVGAATSTGVRIGVSTASATYGGLATYTQVPANTTGTNIVMHSPTVRISVTAATTVYVVVTAYLVSGSISSTSYIRARRVR